MGSIGDTVNDVHVVFVASPFYGHVRILRSLAKELARQSFATTFITGDCFKPSFEHIDGVEFVPLKGKANYDPSQLDKYFPERRKQPKGGVGVIWDMANMFWYPMDDQHDCLQQIITRHTMAQKRVVIVGDPFFTGTLPMLLGSPKAKRVACIGVSGNPLFLLSKDQPAFGSGLLDQGFIKNAELNDHALHMMSGLTESIQNLLEPYNCTSPLPTHFPPALMEQCHDMLLQLCVPELEPPRSDLPENVRFAGTLSGGNDTRPLPEWFQSFVVEFVGDEPLLVVTEGTCRDGDIEELILPTIEACRDLPVRVVVCAVGANKPAHLSLPDNVRWATWIPFEELFGYTSILVSNGGYGGINQAFSLGIPMVVTGTSEDHLETTLRAEMTGGAINLRAQTPTPDQVKEAVKKILSDSRYREAAQKLRKSYAQYDTVEICVQAIHEIADKFYGTCSGK